MNMNIRYLYVSRNLLSNKIYIDNNNKSISHTFKYVWNDDWINVTFKYLKLQFCLIFYLRVGIHYMCSNLLRSTHELTFCSDVCFSRNKY